MIEIYLSIGSNLGERLINVSEARRLIEENIGKIEKESSVYESEPWGFNSENKFLNQVVYVLTDKPANDLLRAIKKIEKEMGKDTDSSQGGYRSRIMDIDILFYGNEVIKSDHLVIPHRNIQNRNFELLPLNEIAADFKHPLLKKDIATLFKECPDKSLVKKL